ncbi:MAG: hypothetical protein ACKO91_09110 [Acidimicrobiales bacterium]
MIIVVPNFDRGGVSRFSFEVAAAARAAGRTAVVVGAGDPNGLWPQYDLERRAVPTWDAKAAGMIAALCSGEDVLLANSPAVACLLPALAGARRVLLVAHGTPPDNSAWIGPARTALVGRLVTAGLARLGTPAATLRPALADEFGIAIERIVSLTHITHPRPRGRHPGAAGVLVPVRLSSEKRYVVESGIALAAAMGVPVTVVGEGPAAEEFALLVAEGPADGELCRDPDVGRYIADADVVVATGITALEACAAGRRVALAGQPHGQLVGAAGPSRIRAMIDGGFTGLTMPPLAPAAVADELRALGSEELDAVVSYVVDEGAPEHVLSLIDAALEPVDPPLDPDTGVAMAAALLSLEETVGETYRYLGEVEVARDWWRGQYEGCEAQLHAMRDYLGELERTRDELRARVAPNEAVPAPAAPARRWFSR